MLIKVEMEIKVTKEDIEEIIEMAGYGISYWCGEAIVGDNYYKVHEDEEDKWYMLSYENILKGISMYVKNGNHPYNIIEFDYNGAKLDVEQVDSEVADMIVQYACFGEIIYG